MGEIGLFPHEEFALWLKDAMTAGEIVNKLMFATELAEEVTMTAIEHKLLAEVRQKVAGEYPTLEMLGALYVVPATPTVLSMSISGSDSGDMECTYGPYDLG